MFLRLLVLVEVIVVMLLMAMAEVSFAALAAGPSANAISAD